MMHRSNVNAGLLLSFGGALLAGFGLMYASDLRAPGVRRRPADSPVQTSVNCVKDGDTILGFGGDIEDGILRTYPALDLVTSMTLDSVKVVDGDIRFIVGGFAEAANPTDFAGNGPNTWYHAYDFGMQDQGSAAANLPLPNDPGVGLARLKGLARIEIRAQAGRLVKFRGAPMKSDLTYFNGRWERPGDDVAFTERAQAMLGIAITLKDQCRYREVH